MRNTSLGKKFIAILITLSMLFSQLFSLSLSYAADNSNSLSQFEVQKEYFGFKLLDSKYIPECDSTAFIFSHIKSGAQLMWLKNNDVEKSFSINFRTPMYDNTGVNHILEHSILSGGSENYPVKAPVVYLLKSSLATYINASTSSAGFENYQIASKNGKDFENLMSVYLDCVFYPGLLNSNMIFKQEGWRCELDSNESDITYNGIVYNEMKNYYSDPQWILSTNINKSLFPDTELKWDSGGDPDLIPSLTYEKFVDSYKTLYSPSNSYISLYGNINIDKTLKFINDEYLSKFSKTTVDLKYKLQDPFKERQTLEVNYPIGAQDDAENKSYMSLNYVIGKAEDAELSLGMDCLSKLLMGLPSSPLKRALEDANIANNTTYNYDSSTHQPVFSITAENTDKSKKELFEKTVSDTLNSIVKNKIDRQLITSVLNQYELNLRSSVTQAYRGILYNYPAMVGWLNGGDPTKFFEYESILKKIKKQANNGYFEKLIEDYLINNNHSSLVTLNPEPGLGDKRAEELKNKLSDYKAKLSDDEIQQIVKDTEDYRKWQQTPDTEENLSLLPKLELSDISKNVEFTPTRAKIQDGIKIMSHSVFTNGIDYMNFYFDSSSIPQDKLHYLKLLESILTNTDTKNYSYQDLANAITSCSGGVGFSATSYANVNNPNIYSPKFIVSSACTKDNMPKLFKLLKEIMTNNLFSDKNRVQQIIKRVHAENESFVYNNFYELSTTLMGANLSDSGRYINELEGLSYYKFIKELDNNFDAKWSEISTNLLDVYRAIFNKNNLVASITGDSKSYDKFRSNILSLAKQLNSDANLPVTYVFDSPKNKEAYTLPTNVQKVFKGGSSKKAGYAYSGKMRVLQNILSLDYLWQKLRSEGGAYDASVYVGRSGNIIFRSFADPNLKETLDVYDNAVNYLKSFDATEEQMTGYIIGSLGYIEPNLSSAQKGLYEDSMYFSKVSRSSLGKERRELLSTTLEDIKEYAKMIEKVLRQNYISVTGNEAKIKENADLFDLVQPLIGD